MDYKRILTIQDISCVGQCSMTVALPILSACGHETCILPSAVLSTHTGGFTGFTVRNLSDDFPGIIDHWQKEGLSFDAVYTGYLGNCDHVSHVIRIAENLIASGGKLIVDPAMADNGKLYYGFDDVYVAAMRSLCKKADIILPNITEACLLAGIDLPSSPSEAFVHALLEDLSKEFSCTVILTGANFENGCTGVAIYDGSAHTSYQHVRIPKSYHGTGDIYSSAFTGAYVSGLDILTSATIAADYTVRCIEHTVDDASHWYGVKFEPELPFLIRCISDAVEK